MTRSWAYRKDGQAWVEQNKGAIVRRLFGDGQPEGLLAAEALTQLYAASRLYGARADRPITTRSGTHA